MFIIVNCPSRSKFSLIIIGGVLSLLFSLQACQAIQSGNCDSAIVGGTNLILTPTMTITQTESGVLSPSKYNRYLLFDFFMNEELFEIPPKSVRVMSRATYSLVKSHEEKRRVVSCE